MDDSDLNALVMNYLINEGYQSAAANFAKEAGITLRVNLTAMDERVKILNDIHLGNIQSAIERINNLDPEVSLPNPLHFPCPSCYDSTSIMHHSQTFGSRMINNHASPKRFLSNNFIHFYLISFTL